MRHLLNALISQCGILILAFSLSMFPGIACAKEHAQPLKSHPNWKTLQTGIKYQKISSGPKANTKFKLHAFSIDLKLHRLMAIDAQHANGKKLQRKAATVKTLQAETNALLIANGGFFDEKIRPLGLLIEKNQLLKPFRKADWGVFYIADSQAKLVHTRSWKQVKSKHKGIDFAIQVGPRVIVDGKQVKLKNQYAIRSALGIVSKSKIVLLISEGQPVESNDLAALMLLEESKGGLNCSQGLMLDGGPSSQLYAKIGNFTLDIRGGYGVPNAVAVVKR
jgi:uncharacterized protein YigE (DUF2233 family)